MPIYQFTALLPDNSVASTCVLRTATEEEAREIGRNLLADNEFHVIEVRLGSVLIAREKKAAA
jgi:hypothetical protein